MKNAMAIVLAAAVGSGAWANRISPENNASAVTVCMEQVPDSGIAYRAQMEAAQIFSEVAVQIAWRDGRACNAGGAIHIHLSDQTAPNLRPGVLASAHLDQANYIEVFYDRVRDAVGSATVPHLLAHVLVHEITHILQGIARHSETGIMKAHWNVDEYRQMGCHHLPFAPEDVELIRLGMQDRTERLQAQSVTPSAPQPR
jgi:hypothetical protein